MVRFTWNLLTAWQNGLHIPQRYRCRTTLTTLNDTTHHLIDLLLKLFDQGIPFGFPNFLDDHLFCGLSTNPTNFIQVKSRPVDLTRECTVFSTDRDRNFRFFAVLTSYSRSVRSLYRLKHDLRIDVLFAIQSIDNTKNFVWIHAKLRFPAVIDSEFPRFGNSAAPRPCIRKPVPFHLRHPVCAPLSLAWAHSQAPRRRSRYTQ